MSSTGKKVVVKASKVAPAPKPVLTASKAASLGKDAKAAAKAAASGAKASTKAGKEAKSGKSGKAAAAAAAPAKGAKTAAKRVPFRDAHSHLFTARKRVYAIGRDLPPKKDMTRFVKWPRYVRVQRQRAILKKRLKVPPAINQFTKTLDKNQAATLFRLLAIYRPESREEKKLRLKAVAEAEAKGVKQELKAANKPFFVKYGLNHVTSLIESKKAKLVVIAHDVDPIELVVWLPALCRKMNVPYCIVKGKARLGHLVHKKTSSVLAITEVRKEDQPKLEQIVSNVRILFNDDVTDRRRWGGGVLGAKAQAVLRKRARTLAREAAAKKRSIA